MPFQFISAITLCFSAIMNKAHFFHFKTLNVTQNLINNYSASPDVLNKLYWRAGYSFSGSFILSHSLGDTTSIAAKMSTEITVRKYYIYML